ncbi:MAG: hydroxyisourate hydrolase [Nakamurella sp.]
MMVNSDGATGGATIGRLSTHVLDTSLGTPAGGIPAVLEQIAPDGGAADVGRGVTDADGRIHQLNSAALEPGEYRIILATGGYFAEKHPQVFYPSIVLQFVLSGDREHYHIAVLTSTFSYTTYLGS